MEANRKALESNPVYLVNAVRLCFMVIQPLFDTDYIDNINGFFRFPELNLKVKDSITSQHRTGEAADLKLTKRSIFQIKEYGLLEFYSLVNESLNCNAHDINQIVYHPEDSFIHVGIGYPGRQVQIGESVNGKITWLRGK